MFTKATERFRSRVLLTPRATGTGAEAYLVPTPGTMGITVRALISKGNSANLTLNLQYADDAGGTNGTAWPHDVPIFVNGERITDAKQYIATGATGTLVVDFCIDPATIPDGKLVGIEFANSHASNMLAVEYIEDVAYRPHS